MEEKYNKLLKKYQDDRQEWRGVCEYVNVLMEGMRKMPV